MQQFFDSFNAVLAKHHPMLQMIDAFLAKAGLAQGVAPKLCPEGHEHFGIKECHPEDTVHKDPRVRHHPGRGSLDLDAVDRQLFQLLPHIENLEDKRLLEGIMGFSRKYGYLTDKQWKLVQKLTHKYGGTLREHKKPEELVHAPNSASLPFGPKPVVPEERALQRREDRRPRWYFKVLQDIADKNFAGISETDKKKIKDLLHKHWYETIFQRDRDAAKILAEKYKNAAQRSAHLAPLPTREASEPVVAKEPVVSPKKKRDFQSAVEYPDDLNDWNESNIVEFRNIAEVTGAKPGVHAKNTFQAEFKDGSRAVIKRNEDAFRAAFTWEFAKAAGVGHLFPPTIAGKHGGADASYMGWVNGELAKDIMGDIVSDPERRRELLKIDFIDAISGNIDRHRANFSLGDDGHVYAIDNDFSFGSKDGMEGDNYWFRWVQNQFGDAGVLLEKVTTSDFEAVYADLWKNREAMVKALEGKEHLWGSNTPARASQRVNGAFAAYQTIIEKKKSREGGRNA